MTEQEFLNKVNSGELFDEDELEKLATENCWEIDKIRMVMDVGKNI